MSTLNPRPPYSPEELKRLYPEGLELKMVQVLFRHGERTPVSHRLDHLGVPKHWPYCQSAALFKAAVLNGGSDWSQLSFRRRVEEEYPGEGVGLAKGPGDEVDNLCLHGELTDRGRETTLQLGQRLRHLYMKQLNFLPEDLPSHPDQYYLRGSAIVRSQISLKQVFIGLYPNATTLPHNAITIFSRSPFQENLYPNRAGCRRLSMLFRDFADLGAKTWNDHSDMKYVQSKIGKYLITPITIDGHPRLSGIVDSINSSLAHGKEVRLPEVFYDPDVMEKLDRMNTDEWFRGYAESLEYRRLGVGSIIGELKDNMVDVAMGKSNRKLGLYGAHDTTVGAILASLGAFDGRWPPYTSNIAIELFFKRPNNNRLVAGLTWFGGGSNALNRHYVRIRYNDVPVVVQGCKPKGKHLDGDETLCTLEAFKQIVEKMQPKDWIKECNTNLDKPGIPPVELID